MAQPQVSICIPTFNRSGLLRQALRSALAQTLQDLEVVVVDNASDDDTGETVRSLSDPRIRYVRHATNIGHRANWNACLKLARGQYISILPDDDAMLPDNLLRKIRIMEENPRIALVHSKYHLIDGDGRITRENTNWGHGPERAGDIVEDRNNILTAPYNLINVSACVFRRECFEKLGGFIDSMKYAWDWEFLMRIAVYWDIYFIAEPLILWRVHSGSLTNLYMNQEVAKLPEDLVAKRSIYEHHLHHLPGARPLKKQMARKIAYRVTRQAEAMFDGGATDAEIRAFLHDSYSGFPAVFRDPRLWKLVLKANLGRARVDAIKRIPFLFRNKAVKNLPR